MSELFLQEYFENLPPVTKYMIEFAQRNSLEYTLGVKPETVGCHEAALYRPRPRQLLREPIMGVPLVTEVRGMMYEGNIFIETPATTQRNMDTIKKALNLDVANKLPILRNPKEKIGLSAGEFNMLSVKFMAEQKGLDIKFVVSSDLFDRQTPFSHNAGRRDRSIVFSNSSDFYKAFQKENPSLIILDKHLIAQVPIATR